FARQDSNYDSW
nr:immunoglobulin heavy chain junction region [Macaca mulatta]MOW94042.1 immunoglobulin heavy chain junction region [Macaca mulatta]